MAFYQRRTSQLHQCHFNVSDPCIFDVGWYDQVPEDHHRLVQKVPFQHVELRKSMARTGKSSNSAEGVRLWRCRRLSHEER